MTKLYIISYFILTIQLIANNSLLAPTLLSSLLWYGGHKLSYEVHGANHDSFQIHGKSFCIDL